MSTSPDAATWHDALKRAGNLHPDRIAAQIIATSDTGLRATRYDAQGGRTTRIPCDDPEHCDDGPLEHSHLVHSDPTGNAAVRGHRDDPANVELRRLNQAHLDFVLGACVVLDWISGKRPTSWDGVVRVNARQMPGSVQAGLDVDVERQLPRAIKRVELAVTTVERIADDHKPRSPSQDEQHWTAGLGPNDVCVWHRGIHERYRRPRVNGTNICADCVSLATLLGQKPPRWLLEAEVDRESKPRAWQQALGRCMDELGVARETA